MELETLQFGCRVAATAFGAPALVLLTWSAKRLLTRGPRQKCPGPLLRSWRRLVGLVFGRPCGYDITGLPARADGTVTCPECGRTMRPTDAVRSSYRFRAGRVGIALFLVAIACLAAPLAKTTSWQRHIPTDVLIVAKRALGADHVPTRLRRELDYRIRHDELSPRQVRLVIPALRADLRADQSGGNAYRALYHFEKLGDVGMAALEDSLHAADRQERQMAAAGLRWFSYEDRGHKDPALIRQPSDALLRVLIEGLADDELRYTNGSVDNAFSGFEFLKMFTDRAKPFLLEAVQSTDQQQRLLAAGLLAWGGYEDAIKFTGPVLGEHLAGNDIQVDARFAARALYWHGLAAEPILKELAASEDEQQRKLAKIVLHHLGGFPGTYGGFLKELWRRTTNGGYGSDTTFGYGGLEHLAYGWEPPPGLARAEPGNVGVFWPPGFGPAIFSPCPLFLPHATFAR